MPEDHRFGMGGSTGRSRLRRRPAVFAAAIVGALVLVACQPDPVLEPFDIPGDETTLIRSMNPAGVAVGRYYEDFQSHAFTLDVATGTTTTYADPPASPDLPDGGIFAYAFDVNEAGVIVGVVETRDTREKLFTVHDPSGGTWRFPICVQLVPSGHGTISSDGLVACDDHVYDSVTDTTVDVAMPPGCDGRVWRVNAEGVALGTCSDGDDPLFVTQLATGDTVGFGGGEGLEVDTDEVSVPGSLNDQGWFVMTDEMAETPRALVYRISPDVATDPPEPFDLGPFAGEPTVGWAIDGNGVLAMAYGTGDAWFAMTYDVATGKIRALDTSEFGGPLTPAVPVVVGLTDDGTAAGFFADGGEGETVRSFVTSTASG